MKKVAVWFLVLISLLVLTVRFSSKLPEVLFGIKEKSGISVFSTPEKAEVFIMGEKAGETPFSKDNLEPKIYTIKIEKDGMDWQGKVKLNANTTSVINRDLAKDPTSKAGEVLTLDRGRGLTVVSNPSGADVEIDSKPYGKTPISVDIESGEVNVLISHPGYLKRSISAKLPEGFNLTIFSDLAISEVDLTTFTTPPITATPEVVVKASVAPNPGFLRVRDKPSTSGKEVARASAGESLILLSEEGSWFRVRSKDGTEGYVSASYVDKKAD